MDNGAPDEMMRRKRAILMALLFLMAGCAAPAAQEPTVIPTRSPTLTAVPTEIATPMALPTTPAGTGRDADNLLGRDYSMWLGWVP